MGPDKTQAKCYPKVDANITKTTRWVPRHTQYEPVSFHVTKMKALTFKLDQIMDELDIIHTGIDIYETDCHSSKRELIRILKTHLENQQSWIASKISVSVISELTTRFNQVLGKKNIIDHVTKTFDNNLFREFLFQINQTKDLTRIIINCCLNLIFRKAYQELSVYTAEEAEHLLNLYNSYVGYINSNNM